MIDGPGDERAIERAADHRLGQHRRRPRAKGKLHLGASLVEPGEQRWQANRSGCLHRANGQRPLCNTIISGRGQRLNRKRSEAICIGQQTPTGIGQRHAARVALEKRRADLGFECANPVCDIRLHRI